MAETIENRVADLERRVSDWEGQMGFLLPLTKQLHREVIAVSEKVDHLETRFDGLETRFDGLETKVEQGFAVTLQQFQHIDRRFHGVEADISALKASVDALPRAIAEIITKRT